MAYYDALTNLPNRLLLIDRLVRAMASSKRSGRHGALMILDVDDFKKINRTYGHSVGDELLVEVALRVSACVRKTDTVARFSGVEFAVMLSELYDDKNESIAHAKSVAGKIRNVLARPCRLTIQQEGEAETLIEHYCSSSIGVVLFVNQETSPEDLLMWADMAMYEAKEAGGNCTRFHGLVQHSK